MNIRFAIGPRETATLDTSGLRAHFLIENIFVAGEIELTYTHYDRMMWAARSRPAPRWRCPAPSR